MAQTLVWAQREAGREARLAHVIDSDLRTRPFAAPAHTVAAALDHYVIKAPKFGAPISVARDTLDGGLDAAIRASEVVHLHGYNGAVRVKDLARLCEGKRVIWTLHDMNPFTGACHYSLGCTGYANSCSSCPAVRTVFRPAVEKALIRKKDAIDAVGDLHIVAPSEWLATEARSSVVFAGRPVSVIPNPLSTLMTASTSTASPLTPPMSSAKPGFVATVVARNLSDSVKNVHEAVSAFQAFRDANTGATLRLIGAGGEEFQGAGIERLGSLGSQEIAVHLEASDVLLVPSLAENAPLVIIEAAATGCPAIVRNVGGMPDMVRALGHGAVFDTRDGLVSALDSLAGTSPEATKASREKLRATAHATHSPGAVVAQYDELYD